MDLGIKDKTAVVTGSTAGIGKAIAKALVDEGAKVVVNGRNRETCIAAAESIGPASDVVGIASDVGTAEGCAQLIADAEQAFGPVDILVNNTGIFQPKPFGEITDDDWQQFFDVNIMSGVRCARLVMEGMRSRGWGRILFISSESGINIPVEMIHYGVTKTAQLSLARGLARELAGSGVTVNSLLPGPTWTEGVSEFVKAMAEQQKLSVEEAKENFVPMNRPTSLIGRFASPEEVAWHAAYLCSALASATTGAAHRVEGGIVNACF